MKTVLFQGDSITDCGRSREWDGNLGTGYPMLVASKMGFERPGEFEFKNRGVSGDRVVDLYARMKMHITNLKPDYMSVLVGVNDVWHKWLSSNEVCADKYYKVYDMLIGEVLDELPNMKIMIMEPYVTHGTAVDDKWDEFYTEVRRRAEKANMIADKYGLCFVPLQKAFDEASRRYGSGSYWTMEGVHPTLFGHELISRKWIEAFEKLENEAI